MSGFLGDLRLAARTLARAPGFTIPAVLILALGVGANAAIFTAVNAVILRPLPYADPGRLVELFLPTPEGNLRGPVSVVDFEDWRAQSSVFSGLGLVNTLSRGLTMTGAGEPEQLPTAYVHPDLFATLGVRPASGRALGPRDNEAGENRVVVLSHRLWQRRFGGDPSIAGRTLTLDGEPFTIAGVMPPSFRFPDAAIDLWAPESLIDAARAPRQRGNRYQRVIARLGEGVTPERAAAEMRVIATRLAARYPETNTGRSSVSVVPLHEVIAGDSIRRALLILLGAVIMVLMTACANVGNLLLARGEARQEEMAVRIALGAGWLRVVRQVLTESLVLALCGGALGLAMAVWALDVMTALSAGFLPTHHDLAVDGRVLAFTMGVSLASALLFGGAPAIRFARSDLQRLLREGGRASSGGGRRLRSLLVVSETAMALVLVVGALLMLLSFARLTRVDPGFQPRGLLAVFMNVSSTLYPDRPGYVAYQREVIDRVGRIAGVSAVGATRNLPLQSVAESWRIAIEGSTATGTDQPALAVHPVSPGYFRAMEIPLMRGRLFAATDGAASPPVAIVSRSAARRLWGGTDPVGRSFRYTGRPVEVVGVVGDVRQTSLGGGTLEAIYVPAEQDPRRGFTLVLRAVLDPRALAPAVRREIASIDPLQPIQRVALMEDLVSESVAQPRLMTFLMGTFAALALALAVLGTHAVISYAVSLRTRELGVRMALGATRGDIAAMVLKEGGYLALAGVALGTAGALGLTRFLSSQLHGVSATDVSTFAGATGLVLAAGLAASWISAVRAARVEPMTALRRV